MLCLPTKAPLTLIRTLKETLTKTLTHTKIRMMNKNTMMKRIIWQERAMMNLRTCLDRDRIAWITLHLTETQRLRDI